MIPNNTKIVIADREAFYEDALNNQPIFKSWKWEAYEGGALRDLQQKLMDLELSIELVDSLLERVNTLNWLPEVLVTDNSAGFIVVWQREGLHSLSELLDKRACEVGARQFAGDDINNYEEEVAKGKRYIKGEKHGDLHLSVTGIKINKQKSKERFSLSERKVIELICKDYCCKEIAAEIYLSVRTVEGLRRSIIKKMGVKGTAGVISFAIKAGIYHLE